MRSEPLRVFLAGASGAIGERLLPLLVGAGHEVAGMTRTPEKTERLRELGAQPVVCDVYDRDGLHAAMGAFEPDLVLHQLTDMPDDRAQVPEWAAATRRMYREGTPNLIAAAVSAGVGRLAAQSVAWRLPGESGKAVAEHERAVLSMGGVVIRYGRFFGPGTYFETEPPPPPRIHIDAAARETIPALDQAGGVVVISER
jgi:nucleoside-diphosphate-sugar epimerase